MKKFLVIASIAAVAAASCTQEPVAGGPDKTVIRVEAPGSKTYFGEADGSNLPVLWKAGDVLSVNGESSDALSAGATASAEFSFTADIAAPYHAAYPASAVSAYSAGTATITLPASQTYNAGTFDPAAGILVGTGDASGVAMVNAMSYIKVTPTGVAADIASIEITANGGEPLCGEFTTDFSGITAKGGNASVITVDCGGVAVGTEVIVALPAQTYAGGLRIKVTDVNGDDVVKTSTKSATMAAGHIYSTSVNVTPDVLYLVGGGFSKYNNDWDFVSACPLVPQGDGTYVTENDVFLNMWCYFRIASADYSRDYSRVEGAGEYWTAQPKASGVEEPFIPGHYDSSWKEGYYMVIFDSNTMKVRCECVGTVENGAFYLNGYGFLDTTNEWSNDEIHRLDRVASGIYRTANPVGLKAWTGFKFWGAEWGVEYVRDSSSSNYCDITRRTTDPDNDCNIVLNEATRWAVDGRYNITLNFRTMSFSYEYVGTGNGEAIDESVAFYLYGDNLEMYDPWTFDNRLALMPVELGVYASVAPIYVSKWCWFKFDRRDWAEYVRDSSASEYWTVTPRIWDPSNECNFLPKDAGLESGYYNITLNLLDNSVTLTPAE